MKGNNYCECSGWGCFLQKYLHYGSVWCCLTHTHTQVVHHASTSITTRLENFIPWTQCVYFWQNLNLEMTIIIVQSFILAQTYCYRIFFRPNFFVPINIQRNKLTFCFACYCNSNYEQLLHSITDNCFQYPIYDCHFYDLWIHRPFSFHTFNEAQYLSRWNYNLTGDIQ